LSSTFLNANLLRVGRVGLSYEIMEGSQRKKSICGIPVQEGVLRGDIILGTRIPSPSIPLHTPN
jgi:hypothetical protein